MTISIKSQATQQKKNPTPNYSLSWKQGIKYTNILHQKITNDLTVIFALLGSS